MLPMSTLASVKSRLVLPFWYWLTRIVPEKGPLNGCVCVCVCVNCCLVDRKSIWFEKKTYFIFLSASDWMIWPKMG